jgi:hypothetical protein
VLVISAAVVALAVVMLKVLVAEVLRGHMQQYNKYQMFQISIPVTEE